MNSLSADTPKPAIPPNQGKEGVESSVSEKKAPGRNDEREHAPYSVFTAREKWAIISLAGVAAIFSPLTANSYFPAIQVIADAFNTTVELINVTVTVYMYLQGLTPMLWGTLSDRLGRRPMFLACLGILCISCVGMALVPTNAYWLLVVLRCLQAAGSASTVALGSGTIADISEPHNRGGFVGLFNLSVLIGPCLGPIIGGLLAGSLGWRSIFWFLTICSGVCFIILLLFFPETLRVMVGDGSIPPPRINRPLLPLLTRYNPSSHAAHSSRKRFINPLRQFTHPSVVCILLFNGTVYAVFYAVTATLSTLFSKAYPRLSESDIGLCFLSVGMGCAVGSYSIGKLLDANFRRSKKAFDLNYAANAGEKEFGERDRARVEADFPIEYARLRLTPIFLGTYVASTMGYGWTVQRAVHISCPLILQFIIGWTIVGLLNTSQTLLMDLYPAQSSSITAVNNLVRCSMGATLISIIDFILRGLRPGWTFTMLGGVCVLVWPLTFLVIKFGPRWRAQHKAKEDARDAEQDEA